MLAVKEGLLTPNAGIDKSNVEHGKVVLYPRNPLESATALVDEMRFRRGVEIGVVVSDSRLMPTRKGTVGVALASAGIEAIVDLRGKPDLFGNVLKVTSQAIADDLCSGAQIVMGEANESVPIVLVRGLDRRSRPEVTGCRASRWTLSSASTCAALDTALGESSFEFHDFDLEVLGGQLRAALLAPVSRRLQDVVGGPQIESRVDCVAAFGTDEFVGHARRGSPFLLKGLQ